MSEGRMTLAVVDHLDNVILKWDTAELGRRAVEARCAKEASGLFAFMRPRHRRKVEKAFREVIDTCMSEVHRL